MMEALTILNTDSWLGAILPLMTRRDPLARQLADLDQQNIWLLPFAILDLFYLAIFEKTTDIEKKVGLQSSSFLWGAWLRLQCAWRRFGQVRGSILDWPVLRCWPQDTSTAHFVENPFGAIFQQALLQHSIKPPTIHADRSGRISGLAGFAQTKRRRQRKV